MAAASDIGANFSQYSGDPSLGGGTLGAVRIDTRPIEDLARYTLLYNKSLFDQRQKDADEKIAELAKLATIHVNDLRGKDRDEIIKQLNDTITYAQEYARKIPRSPKEKIEQNLEWQKKTLDLYNNYNSGKARSIKYIAELDKIENDKTISEATKAIRRKDINDVFDKSKISEQFGVLPDYTLVDISIPKPATLTANIIQADDNANLDEKLTIFNYKANGQTSFNLLNGLNALYLDEKTPQGQTSQARQQRTIESEAKLWRDTGDVMNSIIKGYQTVVDGKTVFDAARFEEENADNKRLMASYNALKNMDADARAKFSQAQQGKLSDRGFGFNLPPNFTADDFREGFVDFTKPIPAEKIINAGMFGKFLGDTVEKTIQETDNLNQQLDRSAANWRATLAANKDDKSIKLDVSSVLNSLSEMVIKGEKRTVIDEDGAKHNIVVISDQDILKQFATLDKEGKTTNSPDRADYDQKTNKLILRYYKTKSGKTMITTDKGFVIDKTKDRSLDPTEFISTVIKGKFPNKDIGAIGSLVNEFYEISDNNLYNLGVNYDSFRKGKQGDSKNTDKPTQGKEVKGKTGKKIFVPE